MFFVHPAVAWMSPAAKNTTYFRNFMQVSGMIAPTFMFLAGFSIAIIAHRTLAGGKDFHQAKIRIAKRGLEILLVGYGLHLFMYFLSGAHGPFVRALKVDILHCIGLTMALVPWIALPKTRMNYAALALALFLPLLSMVLYRLPIGDILPTYIAGYFTSRTKYTLFPFIPYAAWIMFGLFFGSLFLNGTSSAEKEKRFWTIVVLAAVLMWVAGFGFKYVYYAAHFDKWGVDKPQVVGVPHFFWTKGAVVLLLLVLSRITAPLFEKIKGSFVVEFGRYSLFSYCVHLLIIYPMAGSWFSKRLGPGGHLLSSVGLTAVMAVSLLVWKRIRKIDLRELIRRVSP